MSEFERGATAEATEEDEASEAQGVEQIEATSTLPREQAAELDKATLDELDEEERADLEGDPETRAPGGGVRVAPHFLLTEFHCNDGTPVPAAAVPAVKRLARDVLEPMRAKFGQCRVNSAFRSEAQNKRVGGVTNSRHLYHRFPNEPAADVTFAQGNPHQWAAEAERLLGNRGGIGIYPSQNFTHVDIRPVKARWSG